MPMQTHRRPLLERLLLAVAAGCGPSAVGQTGAVEVPVVSAPRIEWATTFRDFGRTVQGMVVHQDFVFTNTGTAALEISAVHPGCGCTTTGEWDRRVEPGRTGMIPLVLNTAGFNGVIAKRTTVVCNDPTRTNLVLEMKADVWRPFEISPAQLFFMVARGTQRLQTKAIKLVSQVDEPVTLSWLTSTNENFQAELKVIKPGKEFEVQVTALPPFNSAAARTLLTLKTSLADAPELKLNVYATVLDPVVVSPPRITMPEGVLPTNRTLTVAVRNNGDEPLTLDDARINFPGASARLVETEPGRMFRITAELPAGFELKAGEPVELTMRSNNPDYRLIRVPVVHSRSQSVSALPVAKGGAPASAR
jgi:hypothetical protein